MQADRPLIVHVVHSLSLGGTERTLASLLRKLDRRTFRHAVVTLREAGPLAAELPDSVACLALGARGRCRATAFRLARWTRTHRPRIIHARNTGTWYDATLAALVTPSSRLVLGFHGLDSVGHFSLRQRRAAKLGLWRGARFTTVSNAGACQLTEEAGIPKERIDVLPNGLNIERFPERSPDARDVARQSLGIPKDAFVAGMVGSLTEIKQHTYLLSAAAVAARRVPGLYLLLVGGGPLRAMLEGQARAAGIADRVQFTGVRENIPSLLAAMDVYVCCSDSEGMSNALLEAMAVGLPLVTTKVGDHALVVRHEKEGLVVGRRDSNALAAALHTLNQDCEGRMRLGAAARARATEFDFGRTVAAYDRLYGNPTSGKHSVASTTQSLHPN